MRNVFVLFSLVALTSFQPAKAPSTPYSAKDVDISTMIYEGKKYTCVTMNRANNRVKAKYFAYKEGNQSVNDRFQKWRKGRSIILVTSGAYENYLNKSIPEGLTIDNGVVVNEKPNSYGGLVIVYATGGIAVSSIKEQKVGITCDNVQQQYDVNNALERQMFISCAQKMEATTFQTHLLVYKDQLKVLDPDCTAHPTACYKRERRFLAVCKYNGELVHIIVNTSISDANTLYEGTKAVYNFLKKGREMDEVVFMINLDTGDQDVFDLFDQGGTKRTDIQGKKSCEDAANLLVYYYE